MTRIIDHVIQHHDLKFLVFAAIICVLACFTALRLYRRGQSLDDRWRNGWLIAAAVVGGAGIWTTHFVAMLAFRPGFALGYDIGLTALSIVIAIGVTGGGFLVARMGGRWLVAGGLLAGSAIPAMHYVGMAAVRAPADMLWNAGYVTASIFPGLILPMAALLALRGPVLSALHYLGAGGLYALGIVGMHFTAMSAVTFRPDPARSVAQAVMSPELMSIAVLAVAMLIVALGLVGAVIDQHLASRSVREAARLRAHVEELEKTRARLSAALARAEASDKSKSMFLATMSHELRTPLNAVIGFSQLMRDEIFGSLGDARYKEYAKDIHDSGAHLLGLINDVLDLSRIDDDSLALNLQETDLRDSLEECLGMVRLQAESGRVSLDVSLPDNLPPLIVDPRRFCQILLNLTTNAIKFTPPGGSVRITAHTDEGWLAVVVTDTGIGMDESDIILAFERFGQVDNTYSRQFGGTGLGLPLARSLAELHGGSLEIESAKGHGTAVTLWLPMQRHGPVMAKSPRSQVA